MPTGFKSLAGLGGTPIPECGTTKDVFEVGSSTA